MDETGQSPRPLELGQSAQFEVIFQNRLRLRRWGISLVTLGITLLGMWLMLDIEAAGGWTPIKVAQFCVFTLLFAALAFGFGQALLGFLVLAEGQEPLKITNTLDPATPLASTAIVMPVYNEDAGSVFGNILTLFRSLEQRGELASYEFYVLSDSTDPDRIIEEEMAWADLCRQTNSFGRIHYRRRRFPVNRKSGNIADFCRRWGRRHRYMIVLDADSVMTGSTVSSLVRMMERNPLAGMIQTMPRLVRATTLFGRIQQFASRLYSPIFAAGLNYWQQGGGNYWGHNAIIRIAPFLSNCALPALPGREPLGGKVLSHDFVEAALMRNGGWEVWFAYDMDGSYEGLPPNLSEYVKRDRRWCQGNLQHMWFLLADQVKPISRLHLIQGLLAYGSAPMLGLFVLLGMLQGGIDAWHRHHFNFPFASAGVLFALTLLLLFGPKLLAIFHISSRPQDLPKYGGFGRVLAGVALEVLFSVLTAPVMAWFHTRFVIRNLGGQTVSWSAQTRATEKGPLWRDVIAEYWLLPVIATVVAAIAIWISPGYFLWLLPILAGLWLAIPVVQFSGRTGIGQRLFLTPEETGPPAELTVHPAFQLRVGSQFVHAILDPYYNAIHVALQRRREAYHPQTESYVTGLATRLFQTGPDSLNPREKRALLAHGPTMARLHTLVWRTPAELMHPFWSQALSVYHRKTSAPVSPEIGISLAPV